MRQMTFDDHRKPREDPTSPIEPVRPVGLPLADAARYLGVSRWTIQRLRAAGEIVGFHVGAAAMIELDSIDAYVARQRAKDSGNGG